MSKSRAVESFVQHWNKGVLILCVIAIALDPLFFYIPEADLTKKCVKLNKKMLSTACILRSIADALYFFHMLLKMFSKAFIRSSKNQFILDTLSILPLPQGMANLKSTKKSVEMVTLGSLYSRFVHAINFPLTLSLLFPCTIIKILLLWVVPAFYGGREYDAKEKLTVILWTQSIFRIIRIYPLYKQVKSTTGFLAQTAWVAAAFNLFLYLLAGHAFGAFWYALSVERQEDCWYIACDGIRECNNALLFNDCDKDSRPGFDLYIKSMNDSCPLINADDITDPTREFDFGIFIDALRSHVVDSKTFGEKFFYCSWWGMRNLSSLGQNLKTSMDLGEILFAYGISICGLVLFALLIGNMQKYLQSISVRVENMRMRRGDEEKWMSQRDLPDGIKEKVRKYEQSKWQLTNGVHEEDLIKNLPMGLRKIIHRHLWEKTFFNPLTKIRIFKEMSQHFIDEMFDRLKPVVFPDKTTIIKEGEAVYEIVFITKGSMTTSSVLGEAFYFTSKLKVGDLCGEELLTWACDPNRASNYNLPISTREVVTESQVEAYALAAEDFKSIASKFQSSIDKKQLDNAVKFHSSKWRTRGASAIQKAWRLHKEMKQEKALSQAEQTIPPFKKMN